MDLKQIKDLMKAMQGTGTKRLEMTTQNGFKLVLEQHEESMILPSMGGSGENEFFKQELAHRADMVLSRNNPSNSPIKTTSLSEAASQVEEEAPGKFITSPMVGTFYQASSPDMAPYAKVGDKIEKGQVVCIIEAMKVMNEIKSSLAGTVAEILIEDGHPIEFGTKLFRII